MPQPTPPEPDSPHGIRLEAVTLVRGSQHVFEGLTLHLQETRIGLVGDNGAGKSSLFRLISGLDQPQQGRVVVHGCDTQAERRQLSKHVADVPEPRRPDHLSDRGRGAGLQPHRAR
ncbi:ATP-binding cassette domain-containing protein [Variovorax sp. Root411]|uniref:ATP-binding cassette domain-containing protein n=1 Tax=Variovorax sp. Root411 TaxID=1736530 RepID=UPI0006F3CB3A|nr:ATP-binding cassette domain-containing protein [Variovorax sp. Root411]